MNWVDLVAIAPFYVELILSATPGAKNLQNTNIIRIVRLARVFRVFKLGARIERLQIVAGAVRDSADMLLMMLFMLVIATILFSTLIYFCENSAYHPSRSIYVSTAFDSIPQSFWWCIVTLMTVGYGDVVPSTNAGKAVASLTMVVSFIILALPISVIGANFTQQWIAFKAAQALDLRSATLGTQVAVRVAQSPQPVRVPS